MIFYQELRAILYKRDSRTGTSTPGRGNSKYEGPEWGPIWPIWSFPEKQRGLGGRRGGCKETAVGDEGREVAEMTNVVGRIMTPQRCPPLKPWKLWLCSVTHQGESKAAYGMTFANQLTLSWTDHPGLAWWAQSHHHAPSAWKRRCEAIVGSDGERRRLGTWEASRSWERQGNKFSCGVSVNTWGFF